MKVTAYNDQIRPVYMELQYMYDGQMKTHCREFPTGRAALLYYLDMCREYINVQLNEYYAVARMHGVRIPEQAYNYLFARKTIQEKKTELVGRYWFPVVYKTIRPRHEVVAQVLARRVERFIFKLPDSHPIEIVRNFLRLKLNIILDVTGDMINTLKRLEL